MSTNAGADEDRVRSAIDETTLARQAHEAWESKAAFWDATMGEGNAFQRILVGPATERLLEVRQGESVLDVACGNGVFSRRLAELGASVVATDFSERFVELARARTERGRGTVTPWSTWWPMRPTRNGCSLWARAVSTRRSAIWR